MPRFYYAAPLSSGSTIDLPASVAHHIHVLRLSPGAEITLFNGDGMEYLAHLLTVDKRHASACIVVQADRNVELPFEITLAQALPESSKMDWIIEKAVELGAAAIQPLASQRCVVRLAAERLEKKQAHWQGVIVAASEQSGRNRLAHLNELDDFHHWIGRQSMQKRILLSPRGGQSLSAWVRHQPPQALALMVGPEGGFTAQEEDVAIARGALCLSMGTRILRTETAGLAALATLNSHWDDC